MPPTSPLRPGEPTELGVYRITGRLGEGAQGVVYAGTAPDGTPVAIKLLRVTDAIDADSFLREVSAARRVAQFCTAQVLGAHMDGDRPYIVSELVDGISLQKVVQQDGPPAPAATSTAWRSAPSPRWRRSTGRGSSTATSSRRTCCWPRMGRAVIDFGIARALDSSSTLSSGVVGTPAYMSPEQIEAKRVGPPSDMFSWAVTMFYAATGRPAFGHDSLPAVLYRVMNDTPDISTLPDLLRLDRRGQPRQAGRQPPHRQRGPVRPARPPGRRRPRQVLLAGLNAASRNGKNGRKDAAPPARPFVPAAPPPEKSSDSGTPSQRPAPARRRRASRHRTRRHPTLQPRARASRHRATTARSPVRAIRRPTSPAAGPNPPQSYPQRPAITRRARGRAIRRPVSPSHRPARASSLAGYPRGAGPTTRRRYHPQPGRTSRRPTRSSPGRTRGFPPPGTAASVPPDGPGQEEVQAPKERAAARRLRRDHLPPPPRPPPAAGWGEAPPTKSRAGLVTGVLVGVLAVAATALFLVPNIFDGDDEPDPIPAAAQGGITQEPVVDLPTTTASRVGPVAGRGLPVPGALAPRASSPPPDRRRRSPCWAKQDGGSLAGHRSSIYSVAVGGDKDKPVVVTASVDRSVRMWSAESHKALGKPIYAHGDWVYAVATAEVNGRPLAVTGSRDGSVRVWDVEKRKAVGGGLWGHGNSVYTVAIGKVGSKWVAASGGADGRIRLWDLKTRQPIGGAHRGPPQGRQLARLRPGRRQDRHRLGQRGRESQGLGRLVQEAVRQDVQGPRQARLTPSPPARSTARGRRAISGGEDNKIRVWDLKTGKQIGKSLTGHKDNVYSLAYREIGGHPMVGLRLHRRHAPDVGPGGVGGGRQAGEGARRQERLLGRLHRGRREDAGRLGRRGQARPVLEAELARRPGAGPARRRTAAAPRRPRSRLEMSPDSRCPGIASTWGPLPERPGQPDLRGGRAVRAGHVEHLRVSPPWSPPPPARRPRWRRTARRRCPAPRTGAAAPAPRPGAPMPNGFCTHTTGAMARASARCSGRRVGQPQVADQPGVAEVGQRAEVVGDRARRCAARRDAQVHHVEVVAAELAQVLLDLAAQLLRRGPPPRRPTGRAPPTPSWR